MKHMLKLSTVLVVAAMSVAACDVISANRKGWEYHRTEDALRETTVTTARLESDEMWGDEPGRPQMVLTITRGSAAGDGLRMASDTFQCDPPTLLRVDDHPIETVANPGRGLCLDLPLESELAKRIMASKELVAEIGGPGGPQLTFRTQGLDLTNGQGRP